MKSEKDNNFLTKKDFIILSKEKHTNKNISISKINSFKIIIIILIILIVFLNFFIKKNLNKNNRLNSLSQKIEQKFFNELKVILKDVPISINEMMHLHTTFKIGGPAKFFIRPKTEKQIIDAIKICNKYKIPYFILGNGSNLLVSDSGYDGLIIQIKEIYFSKLEAIKKNGNYYILSVGGGLLMKTLSIEACLLSLTGLENIIDIPGTVGAGIIMNASFYNKGLRETLKKVRVITPNGKIEEFNKSECRLYLRGSMLKDKKYIVIEATFELYKGDQIKIQKTMTENTKERYNNQPMYFGSPGCFFVWDHQKYGSMFEKYKKVNLVSYKKGNIMIYTYNISFIVNLGKGTASQVMEIVLYIEKIMKEKFNIKMRREVIIIGSINNLKYY